MPSFSTVSRPGLIEKADHAAQAAIRRHRRNVQSMGHRRAVRTQQAPAEAHRIVVAVRGAAQCEAVPGEALLGAADHGVDGVDAGAAHQRVGIGGAGGEQARDLLAARPSVALVPDSQVIKGDGVGVVHGVLRAWVERGRDDGAIVSTAPAAGDYLPGNGPWGADHTNSAKNHTN
jgi:hypothetical protein